MTDEFATLERTKDGGLIRFERAFPNPIEDVWSALTDPERLADWWPPFATNVHVDLREGGTMSFDWPDGPPLEFRFLRIVPPTLLEHTHTSPGSWMRYELAATDAQVDWTADKLKEFGTSYLLGAHCTGIESVYRIRQRLGLPRGAAVVGAGEPPPAEGMPVPPVLALAIVGVASANAAKLGRISWVTRKRSLSSAYGVS